MAVLKTQVGQGSPQTRDVLALAIGRSLNAPIPETKFGVFRM